MVVAFSAITRRGNCGGYRNDGDLIFIPLAASSASVNGFFLV